MDDMAVFREKLFEMLSSEYEPIKRNDRQKYVMKNREDKTYEKIIF